MSGSFQASSVAIMRRRPVLLLSLLAMVAAVALVSVAMRSASAAGGANLAPINQPNVGVKTSEINISGEPVVITDVNVTLFNVEAPFAVELDVLLESPSGRRVMLMSDLPNVSTCSFAVQGQNITLDDAAPTSIPNNSADLPGGVFKPTDNDDAPAFGCAASNDTLVPAPTGTAMSEFNGTDPNGTWKLYVANDSGFGPVKISGGWALVFSSQDAICGGLPATIGGTPGDDVMFGTAGNDVIASGNGEDIVRGLGGDDVICGDGRDDKLKGGAGNDKLFGEKGRDKLRGGTEQDYCDGGPASDSARKCEQTKHI